MLLYRLLRAFLRIPVGVFFRQVEVIGRENVAAEGERAVMLAGNHPNSLIDPLLILLTSGRIVRFAAKDVLFKTLPLRMILKGLGAVPVQRRADHGSVDNSAMFDALSRVLAGGGAMGIFPEGLSHDEAQLQKLKTGAARIALDVAHRWDQPVDVVPVGLTYLNPKRFRSRVVVWYGPPIQVGQDAALAFAADERTAVRDLTVKLEAALRELTVNSEDWGTSRALDTARRLYQPPGIALWQRVELARRFNAVYPQVKDLPEVKDLLQRTGAYQRKLDELGLRDKDLQRSHGLLERLGKAALQVGEALLWVPLALPGLLLQTPVAALIRWTGARLSPRKDVIGTTKLVMGLLLLPASYAALVALLLWQVGSGAAVGLAVLLPLSGYAALRTLESGLQVGRTLTCAGRMLALAREIEALRKERDALQDLVIELVSRLRPAELEPLFPRPSQRPDSSPVPGPVEAALSPEAALSADTGAA